MLVSLKFFSQFVKNIEKLQLSLSKQHNKMIKIRSEKLKIRKNGEVIISSGKVTCTIAKIVPIFKKGERENPSNYRPISILTCFSKILEQIIHKRLISFFDKHGIIQHTQYDFQCNVSTNHTLVDVVTQSFENKH